MGPNDLNLELKQCRGLLYGDVCVRGFWLSSHPHRWKVASGECWIDAGPPARAWAFILSLPEPVRRYSGQGLSQQAKSPLRLASRAAVHNLHLPALLVCARSTPDGPRDSIEAAEHSFYTLILHTHCALARNSSWQANTTLGFQHRVDRSMI